MAAKKSKKTAPELKLQVVYRAITELEPDPKNARKHPPAQIEQLRSSIRKFGFTTPILLRPSGMIGAGHGRVAAAALEGMVEVPTITLDLPEAKWRAYALADNAIPEGGSWDLDILREEMGEFRPAEIDGLGFERLEGLLDPPKGVELEPSRDRVNQTVIQNTIIFDDVDQQQRWFAFLRNLKAKYPDLQTVAARLDKFLERAKL